MVKKSPSPFPEEIPAKLRGYVGTVLANVEAHLTRELDPTDPKTQQRVLSMVAPTLKDNHPNLVDPILAMLTECHPPKHESAPLRHPGPRHFVDENLEN